MRAFTDHSLFRKSVVVTFLFSTISVILQLIVGTLIALTAWRWIVSRRWRLSLLVLPAVVCPLVVGLMWKLLLQSEFGVGTFVLREIGIFRGTSILGDVHCAMPAVIWVDFWQWMPFVIVTVSAALVSQPRRPLEVALVDGASKAQILFHVTLPYLGPLLVAIGLLRFVDCFREFEKVYLLTGGGPGVSTELANIYLWRTNFRQWNMGYGAALSVVVYVVAFVLSWLFFRVFRRWTSRVGEAL